MLQIDFLATQAHYIDHIAPIWDALADDNIGTFYVPHELLGYAQSKLKRNFYLFEYESNSPTTYGINPILVCAYGDMKYAHRISPERKIFMMEHGTGHTFGNSAWPNGLGDRDCVSLFLPPNQYTADKIHTVRDTVCEPIGTPKLDWVPNTFFTRTGTVCISFHHGSKNRRPPEAGSAFEHYKDHIAGLKEHFNLVAHGHPLSRVRDIPFYKSIGVPFIDNFETVMREVDVYVNDLSSTMYEFMATGKPVVVLNAPWFRKEVEHGIRFWDYSDIGIHVWEPGGLRTAIQKTLADPTLFLPQRKKAIQELYPHLGHSAEYAAGVLRKYLSEEEPIVQSDG